LHLAQSRRRGLRAVHLGPARERPACSSPLAVRRDSSGRDPAGTPRGGVPRCSHQAAPATPHRESPAGSPRPPERWPLAPAGRIEYAPPAAWRRRRLLMRQADASWWASCGASRSNDCESNARPPQHRRMNARRRPVQAVIGPQETLRGLNGYLVSPSHLLEGGTHAVDAVRQVRREPRAVLISCRVALVVGGRASAVSVLACPRRPAASVC